MEFKKKRWACLIVGAVIEVLSGVAYAWSVFQGPLIEKYGWTVSQVALAYTLCSVVIMLTSAFFGARLSTHLSLKTEILVGAIFYGSGILLMNFMNGAIWQLYVCFGVLHAIGNCLIYPPLISYALQLFPEKTGFAGGLMTAAFGMGAVIWAPVVSGITVKTGDIGNAFCFLGIFFMIAIVILSRLVVVPPDGFREWILNEKKERETKKKGKQHSNAGIYNVGKQGMMKLPMFYLMMVALLTGLACGGMAITQGSPIMQSEFGLTATAAAVIVSLLAIGNTGGRLLWGMISDHIGKITTLVFIEGVTVLSLVGLVSIHNQTLFTIALMGTTFCYGGFASLVAPMTEELFGAEHISANYSVTYAAFGLSSLIGPPSIAFFKQATGTYSAGFLFALFITVVGLSLSLIMLLWTKKLRSKSAEPQGLEPEA